MAGQQAVLSSTDLVQALLAHSGADSVGLFGTSASVRDTVQPCARHFERWARDGCDDEAALTEEQRRCLNSVGGREGVFCSGLYTVTRLDQHHWAVVTENTPADSLLQQVTLLTRASNRPNQGSVLQVAFDSLRIKVVIASEAGSTLHVSRQGAAVRGYPCSITNDQAASLLSSLLTRTGTIHLPCPAEPYGASVLVPRQIGVRMFRREEGDDWLLLRAGRR